MEENAKIDFKIRIGWEIWGYSEDIIIRQGNSEGRIDGTLTNCPNNLAPNIRGLPSEQLDTKKSKRTLKMSHRLA